MPFILFKSHVSDKNSSCEHLLGSANDDEQSITDMYVYPHFSTGSRHK